MLAGRLPGKHHPRHLARAAACETPHGLHTEDRGAQVSPLCLSILACFHVLSLHTVQPSLCCLPSPLPIHPHPHSAHGHPHTTPAPACLPGPGTWSTTRSATTPRPAMWRAHGPAGQPRAGLWPGQSSPSGGRCYQAGARAGRPAWQPGVRQSRCCSRCRWRRRGRQSMQRMNKGCGGPQSHFGVQHIPAWLSTPLAHKRTCNATACHKRLPLLLYN